MDTARQPSSDVTRWTTSPWPHRRNPVSHDPGAVQDREDRGAAIVRHMGVQDARGGRFRQSQNDGEQEERSDEARERSLPSQSDLAEDERSEHRRERHRMTAPEEAADPAGEARPHGDRQEVPCRQKPHHGGGALRIEHGLHHGGPEHLDRIGGEEHERQDRQEQKERPVRDREPRAVADRARHSAHLAQRDRPIEGASRFPDQKDRVDEHGDRQRKACGIRHVVDGLADHRIRRVVPRDEAGQETSQDRSKPEPREVRRLRPRQEGLELDTGRARVQPFHVPGVQRSRPQCTPEADQSERRGERPERARQDEDDGGHEARNRRDQEDRLAPHPIGQPAEGQLGGHGHGGVDGEEGSDLSDAQAPSLQGESRHGNDHAHGEAVEELMSLEEVHVLARGVRQLRERDMGVGRHAHERRSAGQALQPSLQDCLSAHDGRTRRVQSERTAWRNVLSVPIGLVLIF